MNFTIKIKITSEYQLLEFLNTFNRFNELTHKEKLCYCECIQNDMINIESDNFNMNDIIMTTGIYNDELELLSDYSNYETIEELQENYTIYIDTNNYIIIFTG